MTKKISKQLEKRLTWKTGDLVLVKTKKPKKAKK
jgi:hypothetical protein